MGNNQDQYENDPYIQQSQQNQAIRNLYSNSGLVPLSEQNHSNSRSLDVKKLTEQQETISTTAYKNPIKIDRNSFKLEKDAFNPSIFYLSFTYTCTRIIYFNIYLNVAFNPEGQIFFNPSEPFNNMTLKLSTPPGNNAKCQDQMLKIDMDYFMKNRIFSRNLTDLVIELFVMEEGENNNNNANVECILATFCKIVKKTGQDEYEVKYLCQKCKVRNSNWYNLEDIYGLTSDENICEICCTNPRNTFFLPCKHSFACEECAIMLRIKGSKCPICRGSISDSVVLKGANQVEENQESQPQQ